MQIRVKLEIAGTVSLLVSATSTSKLCRMPFTCSIYIWRIIAFWHCKASSGFLGSIPLLFPPTIKKLSPQRGGNVWLRFVVSWKKNRSCLPLGHRQKVVEIEHCIETPEQGDEGGLKSSPPLDWGDGCLFPFTEGPSTHQAKQGLHLLQKMFGCRRVLLSKQRHRLLIF